MLKLRLRRPSTALVIAGLALFISLGGTGYAAMTWATRARNAAGKQKKPVPKTLTTAQVDTLAAYYARHHVAVSTGPARTPAAGDASAKREVAGRRAERQAGAQPAGAQKLLVEAISGTAPETLTLGLWKLTFSCVAGEAKLAIKGPGTLDYTSTFGDPGAAGATVNDHGSTEGSGFQTAVASKRQQELHGFLADESTLEQLTYEATAENGGMFEQCDLYGAAVAIG
jgi:hypothetical protein